MRLYKQANTIIITTATALLLSACGGGGDKKLDPTPNPTPNPQPQVKKVKNCDEGYTALKKGDKVTATKDETEVKIRHIEDGKKEACVISGEAEIK
jgi:hypothetical protein